MASKTLVLFGFLLVFALFVTSKVAAEQTNEKAGENKAGVQDYGREGGYGPGYGGGYGPGNGGGYNHGGGYNGGGYGQPGYGGGYNHGGGYGPGYGQPGCRYGCCRPGFRGGCSCCMRPDEVPEAMYIPEFGQH